VEEISQGGRVGKSGSTAGAGAFGSGNGCGKTQSIQDRLTARHRQRVGAVKGVASSCGVADLDGRRALAAQRSALNPEDARLAVGDCD
jgi:hypothetical protein